MVDAATTDRLIPTGAHASLRSVLGWRASDCGLARFPTSPLISRTMSIFRLRWLQLFCCCALGSCRVAAATSDGPTLAELKAQSTASVAPNPALAVGISALLEADRLDSANDFVAAARVAQRADQTLRTAEMRYELLLTAVAKGSPEAERALPEAWDSLLIALDRPVRTEEGVAALGADTTLAFAATAECVQAVFRDPAALRATLKKIPNHRDLESWRAVDDSVHGLSGERSRNRVKQILALLESGAIQTATDFENASAVLQEMRSLPANELTHELAVCAMLLGDRDARPLVASSYDRFLVECSQPQRFGTQFHPVRAIPVDGSSLSSEERTSLGLPKSLAKQQAANKVKVTRADLSLEAERLKRSGDLAGAEALQRQALEKAEKENLPSVAIGSQCNVLAETLNQEEKYAEAELLARKGLKLLETNSVVSFWSLHRCRLTIGISLLGQKKYDKAEPLLLKAYEGLKELEASGPPAFKLQVTKAAEALLTLYKATANSEKVAQWEEIVASQRESNSRR
jgi:tetratricopeptide (TPR) repeat protein